MVRVIVLFITLLISGQLWAQASAQLDRTVIQENETVNLTISLDDTKWFGNPDLSVLENHFIVSHPQKSSQSQWINGKSSSLTQWRYTLTPKQSGVITIPAITVGSQKTQPLSLHVKTVQNPSGTINDPIFLEVSTDLTEVLVQQQLLLTVRINHAIQVSNLELGQLEIANARVVEAGNSRYDRHINGQTYTTHEIIYAIFPQQSGQLTIPSINVNALIPRTQMDVMMRQGQSRRLRSEELSITVNAATSQQRIPAKSLRLQENWSADPGRLKVGDSISRTITTTAQGLMAEQLPDIPLPNLTDVRIYSEKPDFQNTTDQQGNTAVRTDTLAIVATTAGIIHLPAVQVTWWNTEKGISEIAELPAISLSVAANNSINHQEEISSIPDTTVEAASANKEITPTIIVEKTLLWPWQLATALSSLLALFFAYLCWCKKTPTKDATPKVVDHHDEALKALHHACKKADIMEIRQALLAWARLTQPSLRIYSLADIKRIYHDDEINKWLNTLEACLYQGKDNSVDWLAFYHLLHEKNAKPKTTTNLYPTR